MARVSSWPRLVQFGLLALLVLPATSAEYGRDEPAAASSTFSTWLTTPASDATAFSGLPKPTGSASLPGPIGPVPSQTGQLGSTDVTSSSDSPIPTAGELTVFAGQPFSFSLLNIINTPIESVLDISVDPPTNWVFLDPLNKALQGVVPVDCEIGSVLRVTINFQLPNSTGLVPRQASGGVNQFVVLINILAGPTRSATFSSNAPTNTFGVSSTLASQATVSSRASTSGSSSRATSLVDSKTQTQTPTSSTSPSGTSSVPIPTIQAGQLFRIPLQTYLRNAFDVVLLVSTQPLYPWVGLGLGNELVGLVPLDQPAGVFTVTATALSLGSPVYTVPINVVVLAAEAPTSTVRTGSSSSITSSITSSISIPRSSSSFVFSSVSSSQTASPSSSGIALPAFTLVPGQPFIFPIALYFKSAGSDRGTGITTNPASSWIIFDQFLQTISGIVPLTQPDGPVGVTLSVTTLAGTTYSLDIPIQIYNFIHNQVFYFLDYRAYDIIYGQINNFVIQLVIDIFELCFGPIFYELDLDRGSLNPLNLFTYGTSIIDAIGYNVLDDFIYGLAQTGTGAGDLIRIGQSGQSQPVVRGISPSVLSNVAAVFSAGNVDDQGIYWAATSLTGNNGQVYFSFDLRPGSGTYGTILSQGKTTLPYPISDWAYVPGGGDYLYALGQVPIGLSYPLGATALIKFDRKTKAWSTVRIYGGVYGTNAWGAVFAKFNGYLYAVDSMLGQTWKFPVTTNASPVIQSYSSLLALPNLDGAACFLGA
ncbi:hypothetical protein Daus18300_011842 [Diaporthe australafricana]|uniref:DUF6923 domain-containing protein n=1 Tax=Diaporthe australafricana TaxID=127596 RepID=A0ABR3W555_9PEZI